MRRPIPSSAGGGGKRASADRSIRSGARGHFGMTPAETAFAARGRTLFGERLPAADFEFEDAVWDVRSLEHSRHTRTNRRVYFTRDGTRSEPLPPRFGDIVKAFCLIELRSKTHLLTRVAAARVLWEAVLV